MKKLLLLKGLVLISCLTFTLNAQNLIKVNLNAVEKSISDALVFGTPQIKANSYKIYQIDIETLKTQMQGIGHVNDINSGSSAVIKLPLSDGTFHEFVSRENNTMAIELAINYPEIKAYDGIGSVSGEIVNWDITPHGFHAMIYIPGKGTTFIDPIIKGNTEYYIVYSKNDFTTDKIMECGLTDVVPSTPSYSVKAGSCELRTYRLALAATGEYTQFHGGTVGLALAAQVTTMNRVNQVYERDIAIRMNIIANNNLIIYTNGATDPYTNNNGATMLGENQANITSVIGSANYDIGHVFSTGGGGIAQLQSPCSTSNKARGVTGSSAPVGDPFDIDYVAHEMGHQFGGNHTQNNNCNRNNATAMEPGSASTIMGYAGICAPNVQNNSDDYFHGITLQEIGAFITGGGHTCPVKTPLSNSSPSVTLSSSAISIPVSTPFFLTAIGSDPDPGDVLTYDWEQMNNQTSTQPPVATATGGPSFRSYSPTTNPTRYFPNLTALSTNGPYTWEVLPSVARTMNFRVTVRDNASGGGCNEQTNMTVSTIAGIGPFVVTYPTNTGITWVGASTQTVTWSVAGTTAAPVSCANVDIRISIDGGATYSTLLTNTPNDGSQVINVPNTPSTTCRIMVVSSNGNFFDISNNNFTITAATNDYTMNSAPASISICQSQDAVYTVTTGSIGGFSNPITLSVSGVPAGATSNFSSNPVTPGNTSNLTISNTAGVTPGSYTITITGNSTTGTKINTVNLVVSSGSPSAVTQTSPTNGATGVPSPTVFTWTTAPQAGVTYSIDISTDASFTGIVDQATGLSSATYNSSLLNPATTYYWRVRSSTGCGSSAWSSTFNFTRSSCSTTSTSVPVAISASGTPTVTSVINIPSNITITDVNVVGINGTHTYVSDLTVTLTSPLGTIVNLWNGICTTNDDFNLNFDDAAAPGAIPCPPTGGGTHQPTGTLADFNGEDAMGNWTLTIADVFDQDGGTLLGWGIEICGTSCTTPATPTISAGGATTFCSGGSVTLTSSSATGNLWSLDGTPIGGATNQTYVASAAGNYTVMVTSGTCSSSASAATTVTVNPTPATPTISAGGATTFCAGGSVTLTSSSATGNQWSLNGTPIGGATAQTYVASVAGNYTVVVTTAGCPSSASAATTVTVNPTPVITVGAVNNPSTCATATGSIQVNGSATGVVSWSGTATGNSGSVTLPYTITGLAAGTYNIIITAGSCPSNTLIQGLTDPSAPATPTISAGGATTFCSGGSVTLTSSSATGNQWSLNGTPIGGATNQTYVASVAGDYTVVAISGGCTSSASPSTTVTVNPTPATPTISAGGATTFCAGGSVTLTSSSATGNQWSLNGTPIGGATNQTYVASAAGNYTVVVTTAGCTSAASAATTVTVNPTPATPTISAGGATTFCSGGSVTLTSSSATGNQWSLNGTPIGGATNQTFVASAAGNYTVTVNSGGCTSAASAATTVTVNPAPPTPSISAGITTFCSGGSVTLTSSSATGNQWYLNGTPIGGATATTYFASTAGNYTVIVTTGGCSSASSAATTVTVNPTPTISLGTVTDPSTCATATGSIQVNGSGTGIVSWNGTSTGNSGSVTLPYTITGLTAGTYNITFTASSCTSNTLVQGLTDPSAPATPTISAGSATTFCSGGSVTLTSSSATGNQWSLNGTPIGGATNQTYVASASGDYTVVVTSGGCTSAASAATTVVVNATPVITAGTVTDPSSCATATGSIQVNGSATGVVSWSGTASGSSGTVSLPYVISGLMAGSYSISIDAAGCTSNTLVQGLTDPSAPATPTVSSSGATTFCSGGSVSLTSSSATGNQWFLNGTPISGATGQTYVAMASGDYTVNTTAGACTSSTSSSTTVTVNPNPSAPIVTTSGSTAICAGNSVILTSSQATGNLWSDGQMTSSISVSTAGIYTVTYTDANGCSATTSGVEVTVNPLPSAPTISTSGPTTFCAGGSVDLISSNLTGNQWSTNATTNVITVSNSGNYTVTYTDGNGCSATSAPTSVSVNSTPTVTYFTTLGTVCDYDSPFTLSGGNPAGGTYSGTGVTGGQFNPSTAGFGNHTITYTYTDANGCVNSDDSDVLVDDCAAIDELAANVVTIFPNPTFGSVNIVSDNKVIETIKIYDAAGRLVNQIVGNNVNSITIDMIEFAEGVYNFEIQIGETIHRERIIRN